MTNVTCRPFPRGAEDIGSWQTIFEVLSTLAVAVNAGMAVFVMHPMRNWTSGSEMLAFLLLEHVMLGLRFVIGSLIPDSPHDVVKIDDFNHAFKRKLTITARLHVPQEEIDPSWSNLDVGLGLPDSG